MRMLPFAWRSLRRELRGGDLLTVAAALVLGVAVMTAVGTLVNRVTLALTQSAAEIIGGDFGVAARQPLPEDWAGEASRRGLKTARIVSFPSVLFAGERSQLADIKAVDAGYPLRGTLETTADLAGLDPEATPAPQPGEAYADARLLDALGLRPGDTLEFGHGELRITRRLHAEPDSSGELFQLAPRLLVNLADVEAAGLLGPGSRAQHRLMFAGSPAQIDAFRDWLRPRLDGHRLISIADAEQQLRGSFERAQRFLALAALLAVLLAGVATALAANRFALRQIDAVAILRCLGAPQNRVLGALALQLLLLAVPASLLGLALGLIAQAGLVEALGTLLPDRLPLPQATPALAGIAIGGVLLLGFGLPPLLRLRGVPPVRVLNRSLGARPALPVLVYLAALAAAVALVVFATRDPRLAQYVLGGLAALAAAAGLLGWAMLVVLKRLQRHLRGPWRLGLAALARRRSLSVVQLVGLSLSLCALLLLAAVGPALLQQWRDQLPADTPNYFLLNVQPAQAQDVLAALRDLGVDAPRLEPFATGRLVAINGRPPAELSFPDASAANWLDRPINFSWREDFPPANTLVAGAYWEPGSRAAEVSVETGWARRFGLTVGDTLTLRLGERDFTATISNLRKADWDSFRVNFFLLLNPGALGDDAPAHNLISSFHLPPGHDRQLAALTRAHPNLSLLDIDAILSRVREVIGRVVEAVQMVLAFSLAAGVLVLLAALQATGGERRHESAVLRTLGARRAQLRGAVLVEFAVLGGMAALLAVGGAAATGWLVARELFQLAPALPWDRLLAGGLGGIAIAMLAGGWGTRRIVRTPPARALREAA
ncbi:MAG: ABC transporter permease [Rehaibacterium terrae]|uniref:ABC transporter permease n=1 Tax=Rehaibacterium terrae TaxID=1341696 RepID=UPI00391DE5CF